MSKIPTAVIVTSLNCGACKALHASGNFSKNFKHKENGFNINGFKYDDVSIWRLIMGTERPKFENVPAVRVLEIEYYKMNNIETSGVYSFTIFNSTKEGKKGDEYIMINRQTFTRLKQNSDEYYITVNDNPNKKQGKGSFNSIVETVIPKSIKNYTVQFPLFSYFSNKEWNLGIKDKNYNIYGKSFGLITGKRETKNGNKFWAITGQDKSKDDYKRSIINYAGYLSANPKELEPPQIDEEKEITKEKEIATKKTSKSENVVKDNRGKITYIPLPNSGPFINY